MILVTGASGFIGTRLVKALVAQNTPVRCLVRTPPSAATAQNAEYICGDLLKPETLPPAMSGVTTAFYLVHAMAGGRSGFEQRDREAAHNFVAAAERADVKRVIYLGGLGETGTGLSEHLQSRLEVARILCSGTFATTFLRAAVIIGSGSASFELIKGLVKSLPIMITPRWVHTRCQPIAVDDVIAYLIGCLEDKRTTGQTYDIGGPDILMYREMMERFAAAIGKKLWIIPVPVLTPKLSSYWVALFSPVSPSVAMPLIEGLANEVICREQSIRAILPIPLTGFDAAVRIAYNR
jgi:uncharacterized protein YbjT (DUF2867 family)